MPNAIRYGLVTQRVIERLRRVGVNLNPYVLFREGARPHQTEWPELAAQFPSCVLAASDIDAVANCVPWGTPERIRARLDKGHLCIVLKNGERVAGYAWADFDEVNDSACDYAIGPDEAYIYDTFIAPEFRGRSLALYMRAETYRRLREAGRHTFYSISDYFNAPAIRFKEKLDAEAIRVYLQIKLGGRLVGQWLLRDYEEHRGGRDDG
jgi:predicted GNAT family acetyltransferase